LVVQLLRGAVSSVRPSGGTAPAADAFHETMTERVNLSSSPALDGGRPAASAESRPVLAIGRQVSLEDRYRLLEGTVLSTGVQAAVRLIFDQLRADRSDGRHTAAFVSGYRGSPLGGLDMELARQRELLGQLEVVHRPAINEELGATAVWGSQLVPALPGPRVDGVLGVWYGKAPGLDRATDALRHGNFVGAHPRGGLLALCGDDPVNKSSTLPSASETTLAGLDIPIFYPGNPQEVLDLGLHAIAASRASGLWAALKIVTSVADGVASLELGPNRVAPRMPVLEFDGRPYVHVPSADLVPPFANEMERTLYGVRLELAREYARLNPVNQITLDCERPRLGLIAAGAPYYDLREALLLLGLDDQALRARGVRILKLGMIWPLEPEVIRRFASGLEEIIVVEAKGPFIESQVRDVLYDLPDRPRVIGKRDERGAPLIAPFAEPQADAIARVVGARLQRLAVNGGSGDRELAGGLAGGVELDDGLAAGKELARALAELELSQPPTPMVGLPARHPAFCSGCPHNSSTEAPADHLVGAGIGCHAMVTLNPEGKGSLTGVTQMGGEGSQWLGQAPFIEATHLTQNMGDGTFSHSGSLAVRAAVAAGVNITFKLLYNGAVAMTGGQEVDGAMPVPALTRWLEAEGVRKVIVTTDELERYRGVSLASIAEVRDRSQLLPAQEELHATEGVTVLIHDQGCAAELRRLRKRGKALERPLRVAINERLCEGCGDCGQKSHCLSVVPVDTEFGSKTQIHQGSCNTDYSCLDGDCPSFVRVLPAKGEAARRPAFDSPPPLPVPAMPELSEPWTIRMIGIGGTGVVTVAQILGMAALLDGQRTLGLDQTGLAQKGGPVVSDVRIVPAGDHRDHANRPAASTVDAYLGFDLLGAASPANLQMAHPGRTVAVVSTSEVQTAEMVGRHKARFRAIDRTIGVIDRHTDGERNVYLDAQALSESVFGDHMPANLIVLGAAWQRGLLPVSLAAIEEAVRLNGVSVEQNLAAFGWGRAAVAAPDTIAARAAPAQARATPRLDRRAARIVERTGAAPGSELERLLMVRVPELIAYQNVHYAKRYAEFVTRVAERERQLSPATERASEAVARHLFTLMAYKDEYEVARLLLDPVERARIRNAFGEGAKVSYMLHPPLLRALGMRRKIALGNWFDPALRTLRALAVVRGTPLDIFGRTEVRRVERALPDEYRSLVEAALPHLASAPDEVLAACELPGVVRGYESVKLRGVQQFREQGTSLRARFAELASQPRVAQDPQRA
jgi:indolepyruvate ferredoxin oxidoreductase